MVRADIESTVEGMYLEYDTFGDPSNPAFLLVMGLSVQVRQEDYILGTPTFKASTAIGAACVPPSL